MDRTASSAYSGRRNPGSSASSAEPQTHAPPWPEWRDEDVNGERWDAPPGVSARAGHTRSKADTTPQWYQDPTGHETLPADLQIEEWKRAVDMEFDLPLTVYSSETCSCPLDLVTPNKHLIHCGIMRWIVSSISNLACLAEMDPFPMEMESPEFIPTGGDIWKPWHHVYSLTKVGRGQTHHPLPNPFGKYIVRLFYLGSWRRITVDDYIPVGGEGRILLPCTAVQGELWPMILTKALLKAIALTHGSIDMNIETTVVTFLTAWLPIAFDFKYMAPVLEYMWELCHILTKKNTASKLDVTEVAKGEADAVNEDSKLKSNNMLLGKATVLAAIDEVTNQNLQGISPSPPHSILIMDAKVITYGEDKDRPPTPRWKQLRWKDWAIRTGLIQYVPVVHVRSARVLSAFRKQKEEEESKFVTECMNSSILDDKSLLESKGLKSSKQKNTAKKVSTKKMPKTSEKKSKSDAKSISGKGSKAHDASEKKTKLKSKKTLDINLSDKNFDQPIDKVKECPDFVCVWCDIEELSRYLQMFIIYYRLTRFKNVLQIPGLKIKLPMRVEKTVRKKSGKVQSQSSYNVVIKQSDITGNTFYLLLDTISTKFLLISLSILPQNNKSFLELTDSMDEVINRDNFLGSGYMVGQKYNWRHDRDSETIFVIDTDYMTTSIIQLGEGLQVVKVWTKLPKQFSIIIASQSPIISGSLQNIQENLSSRSSSLSYYAIKVSDAFKHVTEKASTQDLSENAIDIFWNSYIPANLRLDTECNIYNTPDFYEAFENATVNFIIKKSNNLTHATAVLSQLQILLKKPEFGVKIVGNLLEQQHISTTDKYESYSTSSSIILPVKNEHKSFSESRPNTRSDHTPHKDISQTTKKKKNIKSKQSVSELEQLFLNDSYYTGEILKLMVSYNPELLIHYPFRSDLELEISFADYKGEINKDAVQGWTLFLRLVLNIHQVYEVFTSLTLYAPFSRYIFRVIDNDNNRDMFKTYSDTIQDMFHHNVSGYTAIAYAKAEHLAEKEINWCLRVISDANAELLHSCAWNEIGQCIPGSATALAARELQGYYIPNKRAVVFRALLHSKKRQLLSIRVDFSEPKADSRLTVTSPDGTVMYATESTEYLFVPVLWVDSGVLGEDYVVEVTVSSDSWPLSDEEKAAVNTVKELPIEDEPATQRPSRKKSLPARRSGGSAAVGAPCWRMQVTADSDKVDGLSLALDSRARDELRALRRGWEEREAGRSSRALGVRQGFLAQERSDQYLSSLAQRHGASGLLGALPADSREDRLATLLEEQVRRQEAVAGFTCRFQRRARSLREEQAKSLEPFIQYPVQKTPKKGKTRKRV